MKLKQYVDNEELEDDAEAEYGVSDDDIINEDDEEEDEEPTSISLDSFIYFEEGDDDELL